MVLGKAPADLWRRHAILSTLVVVVVLLVIYATVVLLFGLTPGTPEAHVSH
jgi:hypothetical protein